MNKKEKDLDMLETNLKELERNNEQLEQEVGEYKIKVQSKGRVVSKELKEKLIAYHANDKTKRDLFEKTRKPYVTV